MSMYTGAVSEMCEVEWLGSGRAGFIAEAIPVAK